MGLTPRQLGPSEFLQLPAYGIALTDLAKDSSGGDTILRTSGFDASRLTDTIVDCAPKALAFNGKKAAQRYYRHSVAYGRQAEMVGGTAMLVLPSTSPAAKRYWDESYWEELASFVGS